MSDQYIGEIRMFSGKYAPEGWALCNGQLLSINGNDALYSLIGTKYGGDGVSNFALPDLQGRVPLHNGRAVSGTSYPLGQKGGTETVTLTVGQLPAHTHTVNAQSQMGTSSNPTNNFWAASTIHEYSTEKANDVMRSSTVSSVGGNQAHDNMMPFFALTFIIATQGVYPTSN